MRILIIEEDAELAAFMKNRLELSGYAVDSADSGEAGARPGARHGARVPGLLRGDYDLAVLGADTCREARTSGAAFPVIAIVRADGTAEDRAAALDSGADDCVAKPFSAEELLARIRALLRRTAKGIPEKPEELKAGGLVMRPAEREVSLNGKNIRLTLKEFGLLEYLMRHAGEAVSREKIFAAVWDFADNYKSNTIDTHLKNLRKKLGGRRKRGPELFETVRGKGYRFKK